jgi:D-glycero-beta-D-manno-heptose-7-phosphate kinase
MQIARSVHPLPGESEREARLLKLIDAFQGRRVAVVGDVIADEFIYGRVARVSREAPVLILQYDSTDLLPGGAGNAANNASALGARAKIVGVAGRDDAGKRLLTRFRGMDSTGILRPAGYATPVKTRILAGGVHSAKQQIVRIDRVVSTEYDAKTRAAFNRAALKAAMDADAVLLSDYGTGLVTPELAAAIHKKVSARARRRPVPVLLDSRYSLMRYRGLTACTPNESEVEQMLDVRIGDNTRVLERAGRALLKRTRMKAVLITRGGRGMALFEAGRPTIHLPIFGSDEVADVTGAGDTVIATMTLTLAAGGSFYEAARLANYAGGLVVMKRGTATVSPDELRQAVQSDHYAPTENWSQEGPPQGRTQG